MVRPHLLLSALVGALLSPWFSASLSLDPPPISGSQGLAWRKDPLHTHDCAPAEPIPTHATLVNLHSRLLLALSDTEPSQEQFSDLLSDRTTGTSSPIAPELLALTRRLTKARTEPARIEVVSGYRSWKLNEMLRKKGHNVASHSQHSLGHAMDFRIVGLSAKQLAQAVQALPWNGGLAFYPKDTDAFVHADVGPKRRWIGR